ELHGTYHVPSGPEATFGQALAERRLARQSLAAFLEQAARRLDDEVDRSADAVPVDELVHAVTLREARSEHYIG
ncbi:MAG TPA: hypothetical protein VFO65_12340, partial [Acidimicrobiales bacterium]|nr:hypothetical protein [Acidimicrobiales bacterium]